MISKILQIFKSFSRSLEQFFLTVGQNNFGNKIPIFYYDFYWSFLSFLFVSVRLQRAIKDQRDYPLTSRRNKVALVGWLGWFCPNTIWFFQVLWWFFLSSKCYIFPSSILDDEKYYGKQMSSSLWLVSSMPFRFPFHLPVLFYNDHFS